MITAFDTGRGNVMIIEWALKTTGQVCDLCGQLAMGGKADEKIIDGLLHDGTSPKTPPKSLDRNGISRF